MIGSAAVPEASPAGGSPADLAAGDRGPTSRDDGERTVLGRGFAGVLVLVSSAVVLVTEIVAVRVIAPYVGLTLETLSAAIGCVLAGISVGSWMGGQLADRFSPRVVLTSSLAAGGLLLMLALPIATAIGPGLQPGDAVSAPLLATLSFFLPSVALSAVPPCVLATVGSGSSRLGSIAGSLSAISTAGALIGNFGASFVLIGVFRSGQILSFGGAVCLLLAALTLVRLGDRSGRTVSVALMLVAISVVAATTSARLPCDAETKYVCLNIDREGASGFLIQSNIYSSSFTDTANPTQLRFRYARDVAAVVAAQRIGADRFDVAYIGGGGYTLPLYFEAAVPGSRNVVYEIDEEMVDRVAEELGIADLERRFPTRIGDARVEIARTERSSFDLVIGDAFAGVSVPWHLTTREFLEDVRSTLEDDGMYVMNLIDYDHHDLARAEVRTMREVFGEVAVVAPPAVFDETSGGGANIILIGGTTLPSAEAIEAQLRSVGSPSVLRAGGELDSFVRGADVLRDDFAPVDQLVGTP
jgi:MFS family permease